jgi:site-specific recombinase XerD
MRMDVLGTDSGSCCGAYIPVAHARPHLVLVVDNVASGRVDCHPVSVYLSSLAPGSRRTMRQGLDVIANTLSAGSSAMDLSWHGVGYPQVASVRAKLAEAYAPATANKVMAALKGVMREAFALGLVDAETLARVTSVRSVKGTRLPKGRAIAQTELQALFATCDVTRAAGARNAALLGVAYGAGLRRSEIVGLDLPDYDRSTGVLVVRGKGNKERTAYLTKGSRNALEAWLSFRGQAPGPLFLPVNKAHRIQQRPMTDQAVYMLLRRMAARAKIAPMSPHDCRRTFIGDLLDAGADIATVQALAAHASVTTTARYDRRPDRTRRRAAELLHVPFGR